MVCTKQVNPMQTSLYLLAQSGFLVLSFVYIGLLIREINRGIAATSWEPARKKRSLRMIIFSIALWAAFVSVWSLSGQMADFTIFPFNLVPVLLIPMVVCLIVISRRSTGEVIGNIPAHRLIRLQSFRFFVEILLWLLFVDELLPVQMTFEGRNLDIIAGFTAPFVAFFAFRGRISRTGLIIWNVICLGLLFNIVIIAILSTPTPWRVFLNEPANYIVTYFPVSWLPGLLVPLAYYLHFLSLKQVIQKPFKNTIKHDHQKMNVN